VTSFKPSNTYKKLTKHGRACMQNGEILTNSHVEEKDINSKVRENNYCFCGTSEPSAIAHASNYTTNV
jgi:hypothetical protein